MKKIIIPGQELWDPVKREFLPAEKDTVIQIEHSLISVSKWEAKWCKPFLSSNKSEEELMDYIRCMTLTQNVNPEIYYKIPRQVINEIVAYIEAPMTATTFSQKEGESKGGKNQIVTNELIYYWMVALQIPFECEKWHLNRLLTLIRVCNIKNQPPKKMGKNEILSRNRALNAARRKKMGSKG